MAVLTKSPSQDIPLNMGSILLFRLLRLLSGYQHKYQIRIHSDID